MLSAAEEVENAILELEERQPGIAARVRRAQLIGAKGVLNTILRDLFSSVGDVVRAGSADAARQAAQARLAEESDLFEELTDDPAKREKMEESILSAASRSAQVTITRILNPGRSLSQRIYHSEALAKGLVNRKVSQHLAMGSSAGTMANDLRQFFSPNAPGGVSYAAKRLARTEINNAFHAQSIADAQDRPWVQHMEWHLSKSHPDRSGCLCETYALQKNFVPSQVPSKPHPHCFCYVIPAVIDFEVFLSEMDSGRYDEWAKKHGL